MSRTKVAVVTGSNKGIGLTIAKNLCSQFDGDVYVTSRDESRGIAAVEELKQLGLKPKFYQLDICDETSILKLRDFLKSNYGGLDVLVNNAAIAMLGEEATANPEIAATTMKTNFFGTLSACKILFPILLPHARVVNMTSCMGHLGTFIRGTKKAAVDLKNKFSSNSLTEQELYDLVQDYIDSVKRGDHIERGWPYSLAPSYTVSKIAVTALTRIQQREFDQDPREDIVVNSVHPGYIKTDMTGNQGGLSVEEGAVAPTWLALLPNNVKEPRGGYVWLRKEIVDWVNGPLPECIGMTALNEFLEKLEKPQ